MKHTVSPLIKVRDIAIGFFGWVILSNIIFLIFLQLFFSLEGKISFNLEYEHISLAMWLCTIIVIIVLFIKKEFG